ncbi:low molecular weight protein-tyrosine-phosphatase [Alloscardovia criceti]|uniref:low molecular weight protein-tyrosine-phosphatase n=1 Tax=Alloscardovia criceti TaxID=356828 RepID=UPI00036C0AFE|nr:low molecular weight protein-tyrosine-phosphatase [Alloscardovia criceti]
MYTIMTVCTGNICRSPMAEIVLRKYVEDAGLSDRVQVKSSGVSSEEHGHPIDRRAQRALRARGYELPVDHFAHRISRQEVDEADLFLPMTASHKRALLSQIPAQDASEVHMYRSFDPQLPPVTAANESSIDLVDPWYGGPEDFEIALDQIEESAPYIVQWVSEQLENDNK